jgi:N-dimethylarginine dimethylaminohydrolase
MLVQTGQILSLLLLYQQAVEVAAQELLVLLVEVVALVEGEEIIKLALLALEIRPLEVQAKEITEVILMLVRQITVQVVEVVTAA